MGIFIEIIESPDTAGSSIVSRWPEKGSTDIKLGAQLVVRETESAVFLRDGRALDTFGPGRHTLSTLNIPLLTRALSLPMGFDSPFRAEVYFVNRKTFVNQKWGTMEPILFRDDELQMVRLRAFGMFSYRITHPQVFLNTVAGAVDSLAPDRVSDFFRNFIVTHVADFLGTHLRTVLDLAQYYNELSAGIKAQILSDFEKYGVTVSDFKILSISPPDHVQEMIDKRAGIAAVGSMDTFLRYQAANALEKAAAGGPGADGETGMASAGVGAGVGIGAGLGLAGGLGGLVSRAMNGGAPTREEPGAPASCASCNTAVPVTANFCHGCGAPQHRTAVCPSCHTPPTPGARFCHRCGNELSPA
jgi:membrane protease subunit (stomatin/prohibitin family)